MSQSQQMVVALKTLLKAQGKTYADVSIALQLSEASIKRLFGENHFTLARFEKILEMLGLDFTDLFNEIEARKRYVETLTLGQEAEIAGDVALLLVAVSVINGFSFSDLIEYYRLDRHDLTQKLASLDRLKLIELQPNNRIKLRIAPNFQWHANGPIQRFFLERVEQEFFDSRFDKKEDKLLVFNGLCSAATNSAIQLRMEAFVHDVNELCKGDSGLDLEHKHGNTLVIALRKWQSGLFAEYLT